MKAAALKPAYVLVGDETFARDRFRRDLINCLDPATLEFSLHEDDLTATPLDDVFERAAMPSLMAPLQITFVRNARELYGAAGARKKHGDFPANLERFARDAAAPPDAVVVFLADDLVLPPGAGPGSVDRQRMSLDDKGRLQRLEETLGRFGELVWCARAGPAEAAAQAEQMAQGLGVRLARPEAGLLAEMLECNLGVMARELEALATMVGPGAAITAEAIAALVPAARVSSAYALAESVARRQRPQALASLDRLWAEEGDGAAIGLVFQLSRAMAMAWVVRQQRASDRRALYQVLPDGLRPPGFAADTILALARHMDENRLTLALRQLHQTDVALRASPPSPRLLFEQMVLTLTA